DLDLELRSGFAIVGGGGGEQLPDSNQASRPRISASFYFLLNCLQFLITNVKMGCPFFLFALFPR
ncbi:hypothetical protein LINGRAHAP2_LOCUS31352, partial [Linum grandiflorum]